MKEEIINEVPFAYATDCERYYIASPSVDLLDKQRVYLIELEKQNEALRQDHIELEAYRDCYVDMYDFSPVCYLTLTHEGLITEINHTAARLLGCDRRELLFQHFSAFVAPQDVDSWLLFFMGIIKHNNRQSIKPMLKRNDGTEFLAQVDCLSAVMSDHLEPVLYITLTEITSHTSESIDLCGIESQISKILVNTGLGLWDWDIRTGRVIFNECWAKLRGLRLEEVEPHFDTWKNGIHLDDLPACQTALTEHLENRTEFFQVEYRVSNQFESWIWLLNQSIVIKRDAEGAPLRMMGFEIDVTERRLNEEQLRIASIAFESQEGMIVTDLNAVILRVNQAFTRLTGYSAAEAVGQTPRLFNSGRHDKAFYQFMWNTLKDKGFWQGEIWNRRKDGMICNEWLNISAVSMINVDITHYVASFSEITLNKDAAAKIHHLAYYDPLTDLPNRRLFQDRLGKALITSNRNRKHGALLFIDMDNFKSLNDTLGHDMGDLLLTQVAMRLVNSMRMGDTVARLGGDEFVVMLEELNQNAKKAAIQAGDVGKKVLSALNQTYQLASYEYRSTASIGVTLFKDHKETVDDLLMRADISMYAAKAAGRNTLCFFDLEMQTAITARASLEADLHQALEKNQFKLYFQLQARHDHQVIGAEVLLRWEHPERGLVSPLEFIPLAEETRLILPIGLWVLDTACAQLKSWEAIPQTRDLQLAVNVSAHQFHQACFVEQVCVVLGKHAIQPDRLKLELTESLVLDNINDAIIKMHELKEIGVHFSMDDFGTGYSSLAYLTQLPLNQLKIDQSFVRNIGVKSTDAVIVQTIIGMAKNLGMEVIAEGVETEEQRAFLELHGCPAIQGYLFGRPLPLADFERSLEI